MNKPPRIIAPPGVHYAPEVVEQHITVSVKMRPRGDGNGNPVKPELTVDVSENVAPEDAMAMLVEGMRWAMAQLAAQRMMMAQAQQAAMVQAGLGKVA